jgi:hypothetical protein
MSSKCWADAANEVDASAKNLGRMADLFFVSFLNFFFLMFYELYPFI